MKSQNIYYQPSQQISQKV